MSVPRLRMVARRQIQNIIALSALLGGCDGAGVEGASEGSAATSTSSGEQTRTDTVSSAPRDLQRLRTAALMQLALDPAVRTEAFATSFEGDQLVVSGTTATPEELTHAAALLARLPESGRIVVRGASGTPPAETPELRDPAADLAAPVALATRREVEPTVDVPEAGSGEPTAADRAASGDRPRTWRVRPGETLSLIAARAMGDGNQWHRIYELNRATIGANPERLREGMELRIPQD